MIGVGDEVKQRWPPARSAEGGGLRAGEVGFLLQGLGGARADGWIEEGMDLVGWCVKSRRGWIPRGIWWSVAAAEALFGCG